MRARASTTPTCLAHGRLEFADRDAAAVVDVHELEHALDLKEKRKKTLSVSHTHGSALRLQLSSTRRMAPVSA